MEETLRALAEARHELSERQEEQAVCLAALQATPEWVALDDAKVKTLDASNAVARHEDEVRQKALASYGVNGNKAPAKGVAIKIYKRLVYDAKEAEAWCRQNAPTLFKWDAKGFEKAADKLPGAPVTAEEDPRVTIATDLSEYLS